MRKKVIGYCALCGNHAELTFEHTPPESCGNNKSVVMYSLEHICNGVQIFKENGKPRGEFINQRGFGFHSLCEDCNNNTGSLYINSYKDFYQQGLQAFNNSTLQSENISFKNIYPLRILKAILMFFVSINKSNSLGLNIKQFIKNKENLKLPKELKIFCYFTEDYYSFPFLQKAQIISTNDIIYPYYSLFSFLPFGFILTEDSIPSIEYYGICEITNFSKYGYNDNENLILPLRLINNPEPLNFP